MIETDTFRKFFQATISRCLENTTSRWSRQLSKAQYLNRNNPWDNSYLKREMIVGRAGHQCQLILLLVCLEIRHFGKPIAYKANVPPSFSR
jgi:hypothetical protein